MDMDFKTLEKEIERLNRINLRATYTSYRIGVCIRGLPVCKPVEE